MKEIEKTLKIAKRRQKMKLAVRCLFVLSVILLSVVTEAKPLKNYIEEAKNYQNSGKLEEAVKVMEEALKKYPDSSNAYAYSGLYTGMQAGLSQDLALAGKLVATSFEHLDKAIALDSLNLIARLHRGIMGIKVPAFLGRLDDGIKDQEFIIKMHQKSSKSVPNDILIQAYNFLGEGYQKKGENEKAVSALNKVIELAPGSSFAEDAKKQIKGIPVTGEPSEKKIQVESNDPKILMKEGKSALAKGNCEEAVEFFRKLVEVDSKNIEAYKYLASVLGCVAAKGYDEKIYENTDYRSGIAFEVMNVLDKAVALTPQDNELRLQRGAMGIFMPFFVGKFDQSIEDFNKILNSDAKDSLKAEALYYLGVAYQRKTMEYWDKVVVDYPSSEASKMVFQGMRPDVKRIDPEKIKNAVVVDFVLGFQDALAPQTAVWVEDKSGKFIKTLYVSGFSGNVKEKQVWLKEWAANSKFVDADAVTSASIDVGHHIYLWNLKDYSDKSVKSGEYVVKVEVSSWPSMKYQLVSVPVKLGGKGGKSTVEEGNIIPFVEATYYPKK
jgi:tetratricopeptide (TPR) repeat protein